MSVPEYFSCLRVYRQDIFTVSPWIFRLIETAGKQTKASITIDRPIMGKIKEALEVDFIERELPDSTAKVISDGFNVEVPAYGIASVKVIFSS